MPRFLQCPKCGEHLSYKHHMIRWGRLTRDAIQITEETWEDTDDEGEMEVFCVQVEECGFTVPPKPAVINIVFYIDALKTHFDFEKQQLLGTARPQRTKRKVT